MAQEERLIDTQNVTTGHLTGDIVTGPLNSSITINYLKGQEYENFSLSELPVGIGTVQAYGWIVTEKTPVIVESSFNTPAVTGIIPGIVDKSEVAHEASLAATAITRREKAVIPQQASGVVDYWYRKGVTPIGADIIEVPLHLEGDRGFHYPHTDALQQAKILGLNIQNGYIVNAFPDNESKDAAREIGLLPVQDFNPAIVGSKAMFHEGAEKFGYTVAPSLVIHHIEDIHDIYARFTDPEWRNALFGNNDPIIWIKLLNSSGGEGVRKINFAECNSWEEVEEKFLEISRGYYDKTRAAFLNGTSHSEELEQFWPKDSLIPREGLIVEADLSILSHMDPTSYSNVLFIDADGKTYQLAEFQQLIGEGGKFLGSVCIDETAFEVDSESTMGKHGTFLYENGVRGFVGIDYKKRKLPIQTEALIESNIRQPMSDFARRAKMNLIRELAKRGISIPKDITFANTVFEVPGGIHKAGDIEEFYAEFNSPDIDQITPADLEKGIAIAIGSGSYKTDTGETIVSNETRTLLLAPRDKIIPMIETMKKKENVKIAA